ncbi:MAG TPA: hypothetical protein VGF63_13615 [Solirubrobacteraceae bacterium]|jgi:hypothetical protein
MAIDQKAIGVVAAEMMEELEQTYGDEATIERVAIVVAVTRAGEDTVHWKFTPGTSVYMGKGLLAHVHDNIGK